MADHPHVSIGGHDVEVAPPAGGGKAPLMARAASVGAGGPRVEGAPYHYALKIDPHHPNVHLKTKAHWIIGWVPPPAKKGHKRTFIASRRWVQHGFARYWGYVEFDGRKHHGWIDGVHVEAHRTKTKKKTGSYEAYRHMVHGMMKRAWRYRSHAHHKIPVRAMLRSTDTELHLYHNPKISAENLAETMVRPKHANGFVFTVRYASASWMLVHHGKGHTWHFVHASYKDLEINHGLHERDKETQTMKFLPAAWA